MEFVILQGVPCRCSAIIWPFGQTKHPMYNVAHVAEAMSLVVHFACRLGLVEDKEQYGVGM